MTQPNPGKLVFKLFQGDPQPTIDEANEFIDQWDLQKFPITNMQTIWNEDQTKITIFLTIAAPMGTGKPDLARVTRFPNGHGA